MTINMFDHYWKAIVVVWWLDMQSMHLTTIVVRSHSWQGVLDTTCDKVQWLAAGRWNYPGNPDSSTNKTNRHDITEILLKVALITMTITQAHHRK